MQKLKPCILVADDDTEVLTLVRRILEDEKYQVITASSGEDALAAFENQSVDMVLLDIIMPGIDGYAVCRTVRQYSNVPVIMLTALGSDDDRVKGLNAGADDFVTKPFKTAVMLARIRSVLRRSSGTLPTPSRVTFNNGRLEIDFANRWVSVDGREVRLTPTEFCLIQEMTLNIGKVLTHTQLLLQVWGTEYQNETEYLHVFVRGLRTKLGLKRQGSGSIESIADVGYCFNK
jgi:two-component system KDP operon response regulator KdpE